MPSKAFSAKQKKEQIKAKRLQKRENPRVLGILHVRDMLLISKARWLQQRRVATR
jgi:hypothetical protein